MSTDNDTRTHPAEVRRGIYERMSLMKASDDRMVKGIGSGEFIAIYYSYRGQEGVAASLGAVLRDDDQLVTTYRGLHDHIGKGVPLGELYGEVLGRQNAPSGGKGGIMHIARPDSGVMLSTGIVGAGVPVATGLALAAQLDGSDRVTAVCFGDGATNTGSFHEAANLAAVWDLPVVLVCQNNLYGEKTPIEMTMRVEHVADRATAFGMPGVCVNGNDPDATYTALADAVERARSGAGPTLVECVTFRFRGHSFGDDMRYIPADQLEAAIAADPVPAYRQRLLDDGVCREGELSEIDARVASAVDEAVRAALEAPEAPADGLLADVYADATSTPA
jgi:pyruvate dehydrogenase E1 component alpha subunit